jgi:hypothetical protein
MPTFYFDIRDTQNLYKDEEGMELPDLNAARREAEEGAREMLADALKGHKVVDGKRIEIADENRSVLEIIKVRDFLD